MPSRHLVDPQILPMVEQAPAVVLDAEHLAESRAAMVAMAETLPQPAPLAADLKMYEERIPGLDGAPDVRLIITAPKASGSGRPGILHIHGGGYIMGSADMTAQIDAAYAGEFGAVCVSVDYRLAPETPHPGPVNDCYAALKWLHENAQALGVDPDTIAVTGESAGGGLAAALVLLARDRAEVPVAFQHLIYPMLDDRTATRDDPSPYLGQFIWTQDNNHFGWRSLIGGEPGGADVSPYAAPARAEDLSGLPPTFIACGALDLFLEEDLEYARRLILAGVSTELHIYPGGPHAFNLVPDADITMALDRDSMGALKRALTKS
ncbi:alpha/beta hydrolase [Sphingobium sp. TB-6]|uniref:alpha/beta hydrolase n=1 Tax=Sphingobium sp. TB-6 TaxID=2728850 RepID=UPI00146B1007|nr:alpha/beta hydrolase [Sphingobium sp. TB-6]NML87634.1 alpha/beta hydrolase [Sphingobium sp. TB-6]